MKKKTDKELVETVLKLKKKNQELSSLLSVPTRKRFSLNLDEINKQIKEEKTLIVPGKVLGRGNIEKKIKIIALNFSRQAEKKLKKAGCEAKTIVEELKKNEKIDGKILK